MYRLAIIFLGVLLMACNEPKKTVTNSADYNKYLSQTEGNDKLQFAKNELDFWTTKFDKAPNQSTFLTKMAGANNQLFEITGQIEFLNSADVQLAKATEMRSHKSASLERSLAKTRITQHRFLEAKQSLMIADSLGEQKLTTQKMLFDVEMELGNYKESEILLSQIGAEEDFDYLIRLAKWLDYKGNTSGAISKLELALTKADNENLKLWLYSNLGDFYGHVGNINQSYSHYLKALAIDPHYLYALKGIAWINFSHENNVEEAERIITFLEAKHAAPDYLLLRSEIAKFKGDLISEKSLKKEYISKVSQPAYGDMYNAYLVTLLENDPQKALALAKKEVSNRPTPQSYQLLSWALCQNGNNAEALSIAEIQVKGKTFEPKSLFHLAEVYKLNGKDEKVKELKLALEDSFYEVGPNVAHTIIKL
jgi:tetratricopeptide (TPR) repeat protein